MSNENNKENTSQPTSKLATTMYKASSSQRETHVSPDMAAIALQKKHLEGIVEAHETLQRNSPKVTVRAKL